MFTEKTQATEKRRHRLIHAIEMGSIISVKKALKLGASPRGDGDIEIPLLTAITGTSTDLELVQLLLEAGADPNERHDSSSTALTMACESAHIDLARLLLARGADPNIDNGEPLLCATQYRDVAMVDLLIGKGADPNLKGIFYCRTPLIAVSSLPYKNPGDLQHNPAWNSRYYDIQRSKISHAMRKKQLNELYGEFTGEAVFSIMEILIKHGALIDDTSTGTTAFHTAIAEDNTMAELCLIRAGASAMLQDRDGKTATALYLEAAETRSKVNLLQVAMHIANTWPHNT